MGVKLFSIYIFINSLGRHWFQKNRNMLANSKVMGIWMFDALVYECIIECLILWINLSLIIMLAEPYNYYSETASRKHTSRHIQFDAVHFPGDNPLHWLTPMVLNNGLTMIRFLTGLRRMGQGSRDWGLRSDVVSSTYWSCILLNCGADATMTILLLVHSFDMQADAFASSWKASKTRVALEGTEWP